MAEGAEYGPDPDILTDEIIDKHLGGGPATATDPAPGAEADDEGLDIAPEDILSDEEGPLGSDEGAEAEAEAGEDFDPDDPIEADLDEDLLDEDDDFEDEEDLDLEDDLELEADEPQDVLEGVSAEELERIESDPALDKLHKHMQRHFTRRTQEVADREKDIEARESSVQRFESALRTPGGMAEFVARTLAQRPDVIGAAFETVATHEEAGRDFLIEVGLHTPEVFEAAYDRVQELMTDESERQRHERDRDQRVRDTELRQREQQVRRQTFNRDYDRLDAVFDKALKGVGITEEDDVADVRKALNDRVRERVQEDGTIDLSPRDVRELVKAEKQRIERHLERARKRLERRNAREARERAKRKARESKGPKRSPPRGAARKTPKERTKFEAPEGRDGLDAFIEHRLAAS